jgi:hypothetical protein
VLAGAVNATITSVKLGRYQDDQNPLGCGLVDENPGHKSFLGTWLATAGGTTYLFYLNIEAYQGPGTYPMATQGTYLLLNDPSSRTAGTLFYPAAKVTDHGEFIDNPGKVVVNADQRSGTVTTELATAADFQAAAGTGTAPKTSLTITGAWACP